jgi:hypothetical protein
MTGLMDKIRAVLGRRRPQPRDPYEALGSPSSESSEVPPGEPTLGSALGMNVRGLARGGAAGTGPEDEPADDLDSP